MLILIVAQQSQIPDVAAFMVSFYGRTCIFEPVMNDANHTPETSAGSYRTLEALHAEVDAAVQVRLALIGDQLVCKSGCCDCCVDDLTVFAVEADLIRHHHAKLLALESSHESGACAFLDDHGACRIYENRPYVCRTQGLPLRWLDEDDNGQTVEYRDICPLNDAGVDLETLQPDHCWTLGSWEGRLASLQAEQKKGPLVRVPLRALFKRG